MHRLLIQKTGGSRAMPKAGMMLRVF